MQSEASGARAARLAADVLHIGRPRTLQEILDGIEAVDAERVNAFLAARPPAEFTVVSLGPRDLTARERAA
jgi:predicted Zn-dependent peptidase